MAKIVVFIGKVIVWLQGKKRWIVVGAFAGNWLGLASTPWVSYLAGVGSILLTFLAGAEIDPVVIRKHFWSSVLIGAAGFFDNAFARE